MMQTYLHHIFFVFMPFFYMMFEEYGIIRDFVCWKKSDLCKNARKTGIFTVREADLLFLSRAENVSCDSNDSKNRASNRSKTGKLLFFCLSLVFAEVRIAGSTADSAGKTAFFGTLEHNKKNDGDGCEHKNRAENISENCHFINLQIGGNNPRIFSLNQGVKTSFINICI